jgi:hypothetical protein
MRFRTTIVPSGKTTTGIQVPDEVNRPAHVMRSTARR